MSEWNHISLFAGGEGFGQGFQEAGFNIIHFYYSEIDKHALALLKYRYPNGHNLGSVTDVSGLKPTGRTFVTFGWPCQDNSIAGKRKGHAAGTRSGLLSEAVRVIDEVRPEFFCAENVEGLRTVNKGIDIIEAVKYLTFLNESLPQYDVEMQLLNTRWFLPQNRERLYFVGHLRNGSRKQVFPIGENDKWANEGYGETPNVRCLTAGGNSGGLHSNMTLICDSGKGRKLECREIMPPLRSNTGVGHGNYIACINPESSQSGRVYGTRGIAPALYSGKQGVSGNSAIKIQNEALIRRLTPIECERLQGWPDNWTQYGIYNGKVKPVSDTQRYRICGNGVSKPCVTTIAEKLLFYYTKL